MRPLGPSSSLSAAADLRPRFGFFGGVSLSNFDSRFILVADWRFLAASSFLPRGLPPIFIQYSCSRSLAPLREVKDHFLGWNKRDLTQGFPPSPMFFRTSFHNLSIL